MEVLLEFLSEDVFLYFLLDGILLTHLNDGIDVAVDGLGKHGFNFHELRF
jgi:hypothetical protein